MKRKITYLIFTFFIAFFFSNKAYSQYTLIPDTAFEKALINYGYDQYPLNGSIKSSRLASITVLSLTSSNIKSLKGIEDFISLKNLVIGSSKIDSLDLSQNLKLEGISCGNSPLRWIKFFASGSELKGIGLNNTQLTSLEIKNARNLTFIHCFNSGLKELKLDSCPSLESLKCANNKLTNLNLEGMTRLREISVHDNLIDSISLPDSLPNLTSFIANNNNLSSINLEPTRNLLQLEIKYNKLTSLNLVDAPLLKALLCSHNGLTNLDLSSAPLLLRCDAEHNQIANLKLNNNQIVYLYLFHNELENINLSSCTNLSVLNVASNKLLTLDVNKNLKLEATLFDSNDLRSIYLKNGQNNYPLNFKGNENLVSVCADENEVNDVLLGLQDAGITAAVSDACIYKAYNKNNLITLTNHINNGVNVCENSNWEIPYLKYNILNESGVKESYYSNFNGICHIYTDTSLLAVDPVYNTSLFNITFNSNSISPNKFEPIYKDKVCFDVKNPLLRFEASMFAKTATRPGFTSNYTIPIVNEGNVLGDGVVQLSYNYKKTQFMSAEFNPAPTQKEPGILQWDLPKINPFERKDFNLSFKANRPTDSIPLNGGDFLAFNIKIVVDSSSGKDTLIEKDYKDRVVNSYDPNDMTCLQGKTHAPDIAGKPLDYMVRFENTGTASAIHVRVQNEIDTNKFDISSLEIIKTSHSCLAKLSNTNRMEFMFEDINLSHLPDSSKGYVVYRINTLPHVKVGDTFSNQASIFFDYNFPIITNDEKTPIVKEVSSLGSLQEIDLRLFPNPTDGALHIDCKQEISSVKVFNSIGSLLLQFNDNLSKIDLSALRQGLYMIELTVGGQKVTKRIVLN